VLAQRASTADLRCSIITYLLPLAVDYTIEYYSEEVQEQILTLPDTLAARYIVLTRRMVSLGPNLGQPHTKAFGGGLFELRLKGVEGIARVFFCTLVGRRIVMLHGFLKKSERTPPREREIAERRMKEVKHENA
jgi:phage-related protein